MAITDRFQGYTIGVAVKPPCVVASTAALTLSDAQTIDGISVGSCERVLVKDQANSKLNGIYLAGEAAWRRSADWDGRKDAIPGTQVYVDRGNTFGRVFFVANSSSTAISIDIGATGDDVTWSQVTPSLTDVSAGTVVATGSTAERALEDRFAEALNAKDYSPITDGVSDTATQLAAWLAQFDTSGKRALFLPHDGNGYFVSGGQLLIENFASGTLSGQASGFGSRLVLLSGETAPILRLGGQSATGTEPFDSLIEDMSFHGGGNNLTTGLLEFGKSQRFLLKNLRFNDWDTGAAVSVQEYAGNPATQRLAMFNNMHFLDCRGTGNGETTSDVVFDILLTRFVLFTAGSAENAAIGVKLRASGADEGGGCHAHFSGFHIERTNTAIDALDVQVTGKIENSAGVYRMRQGCVGCDIIGPPGQGKSEKVSVLDENFGNRYYMPGALTIGSFQGATTNPGLFFDGGELLRTLNAIPDPTFRDAGLSNWTSSNATLNSKALTLPNANGRAISIAATAANGYAETDIYPDESADYLLMVGFAIDVQSDASARIEVIDTSGPTTLWDSGALDYTGQVVEDNTIFRFVYKRIPTGAGASGTNPLKIRLYSVVNGTTVYCPLLLFMKSTWNMETDFTGADASLVGSGVGAQISNSAVGNTEFRLDHGGTDHRHYSGGIFHVSVDARTGAYIIGFSGDTNDEEAGPLITDANYAVGDEFNLLSSLYPPDGRIRFRSFSGGDITISEAAMLLVGSQSQEWGVLDTTEDTALSATTTRRIGVAPVHNNLMENSVRLVVGATIAASGVNYWTIDILRRRGATEATMATADSQSGWTADTAITIPIQNRTVEPGDIIKVVYTRTSTPTNLEPTVSMKFGWDA